MKPALLPVLGLLFASALLAACHGKPAGPLHRERFTARDADCRDPARPHAFMYPAQNRTDYRAFIKAIRDGRIPAAAES